MYWADFLENAAFSLSRSLRVKAHTVIKTIDDLDSLPETSEAGTTVFLYSKALQSFLCGD
jgi:hypothetical protein